MIAALPAIVATVEDVTIVDEIVVVLVADAAIVDVAALFGNSPFSSFDISNFARPLTVKFRRLNFLIFRCKNKALRTYGVCNSHRERNRKEKNSKLVNIEHNSFKVETTFCQTTKKVK